MAIPEIQTILYFLAEIIIIGFGIYALWLNYHVIKENHNPADKVLMVLISLFILRGIRSGLPRILNIPKWLLNFDYINESKVGTAHILDLVLAMFGLWFILYLFDYREIWGVPFFVGFFIAAHAIVTGEEMTLTLVAVVIGLSTYAFHFYNAIKNKNGTSFALAMVGVIAVIDYAVSDVMSIYQFNYFYRFATLLFFILALNGIWDEKIFYDRKERNLIKNTWITTFVS